jgi:hypothetical protein
LERERNAEERRVTGGEGEGGGGMFECLMDELILMLVEEEDAIVRQRRELGERVRNGEARLSRLGEERVQAIGERQVAEKLLTKRLIGGRGTSNKKINIIIITIIIIEIKNNNNNNVTGGGGTSGGANGRIRSPLIWCFRFRCCPRPRPRCRQTVRRGEQAGGVGGKTQLPRR